jgi:phosphate/sulfate permease
VIEEIASVSAVLMPFISAVIGGLVASFFAYKLGLRRDQEERRRERIIARLIEAYRNIENAAGRLQRTPEMTERLESSLGAIFLLGSNNAAKEANKLAKAAARNEGDMTALLQVLRQDLRSELGLTADDVELLFLRFDDGNPNKVNSDG